MIAQVQNIPASSMMAVAGQSPEQGAAEGFAALMRGNGSSSGTSSDPVAPQTTPAHPNADAEGVGQADASEDMDLETPEGLMALLDETIAELHDGAGQVTPKTALAGFAEALGEAPVEAVGELEAVANLADPDLEAALQEKINGALRLATGVSQLSVASAGVPVVGRSLMAAVRPQNGAVAAIDTAEAATAQDAARAPIDAGKAAAPQGAAVTSIEITKTAAPLATGQGPQALASTGLQVGEPIVTTANRIATDNGTFQTLRAVADSDITTQMPILRQSGAEQPTAPDSDVAAALKIADPRLAATEQFSAGAEATKALQGAAPSGGAETALREFAATPTPQTALPGEPVRLSPPAPTPAPPPSPTAAPEEQLRQHVTQQIRSLDVSDNKLRFSLSPYGMGEIEIEVVRSEGGRMQIAMTTESASVLSMLRQDRDQLLDALQSRGISADTADLDFQTFGERGRQDGRNAQLTPEDNAKRPGDSDGLTQSDAGTAPDTRMTSGPGQLDILT